MRLYEGLNALRINTHKLSKTPMEPLHEHKVLFTVKLMTEPLIP